MATDPHQIQLSDDQLRLLAELSVRTGKPQKDVLSDALRQYHPTAANGGADSGSDETVYDVLKREGLIGCIKGGPPDLSTNPKYMEGFGESDD